MEQGLIMLVGQEQDNMTYKQYLRKVEKLERVEDEEGLSILEQELMESLDNNLDMDFTKDCVLDTFDDELEDEYGDLF